MRARLTLLIPAYLGLAVATTWPAAPRLGSAVPGSASTDLWDGLWSIWFVARALSRGELPYATTLLDHPHGGTLAVADPLGALLASPLVLTLGLPVAATLLVLGQLSFSGVAAHRLAEAVIERLAPGEGSHRAAWLGGVAYATAPVLLCGVHNGNSESYAGGWAALAALMCWRLAVSGGWRRALLAGGALALAALGSWYGGVVAFLFAGALVLLPPPGSGSGLRARAGAVLLGLALAAPLAVGFQRASTSPDNLVGIKDDRETALVRRTTGPADPVAYVRPGDYRSPDFRKISRYGEDFVHSPYLGLTLVGLCAWGLRRRRTGTGALLLAGGAGLLLSLGPVLASGGMAVIFLDDRAMPLPYLLLERLPGFRSLSLVWRLGQAAALAASALGALALAGRSSRVIAAFCALVVLEIRLLSPVAELPATASVEVSSAVEALAGAEPGAVMNFPVVGGRSYLYEQTVHGHPLAGTLNFPNNAASRKIWQALLDAAGGDPASLRARVGAQARKQGVRYLVVHEDSRARPDMHDKAVRALAEAMDPLFEGEAPAADGSGERVMVRIYALW